MPIVEFVYGTIEYEMCGTRKNRPHVALVFLHGWLMSPQMWLSVMQAFESQTLCIAFWQPGHGKSSSPDPNFTMEKWADALMDTLGILNVKQATLIGHSMGGMLALQMALKYPERINGLVLVDTQDDLWDKASIDLLLSTVDVLPLGWGPTLSPQIAAMLMSQKFLQTNPAWLSQWTNEVAKYDLSGQRHLMYAVAYRKDLSKKVKDLKIPVLVIHGTDDKAIAFNIGKAMSKRIPGALLEEIAGAGHCPPLEQPEVFTKKLTSFLKAAALI